MAYTCIDVIIFCFTSREKHQIKKNKEKIERFHIPWIRSKKFPQLEPEISKRTATKYEVANAENYLLVLKVTRSQ